MPVMDEFKKERDELKQKGLKEKLSYYIYYYKWHTLAVIAIIAIVISIISNIVNHKDCAFYAGLINSADTIQSKEYVQSFAEYAGIDTNEYDVFFDTTMSINGDGRDDISISTYQRLTIYTAAGDMDILIAAPEIVERYAYNQFYYDLRDLLTSEEAALCEPYFYYVDQSVISAFLEAQDSGQEYEDVFPDPRHPEEMEDPIPVGLFLDDCNKLKENFFFASEDIVLGVYINSKNVDTAVKFIEFIMQEP